MSKTFTSSDQNIKTFGKKLRELFRDYKNPNGTAVNAQPVIQALANTGVLAKNEHGKTKGVQQDAEEILTELLKFWSSGDRAGFEDKSISEDQSEDAKAALPRSLVAAAPTGDGKNLEQVLTEKAANLDLRDHLFIKVSRHPGENQNLPITEKMQLQDKAYQLEAFTHHSVNPNHYVTYAKQGDNWYLFNDATVSKVDNIDDILGQSQANITMARFKQNADAKPA
jgi:uncharacterized UBP type Zn finger protein